jgi:hypothetical protein
MRARLAVLKKRWKFSLATVWPVKRWIRFAAW